MDQLFQAVAAVSGRDFPEDLLDALEEEDITNVGELKLMLASDLQISGFKFGHIRRLEDVLSTAFDTTFRFPVLQAKAPPSAGLSSSIRAKWVTLRGPYDNPGKDLVHGLVVAICRSWPPTKSAAAYISNVFYVCMSINAMDVKLKFHVWEIEKMASRIIELLHTFVVAEEIDVLYHAMIFRRNWCKGGYGPRFPYLQGPETDDILSNGNPDSKLLLKMHAVPRVEADQLLQFMLRCRHLCTTSFLDGMISLALTCFSGPNELV